MLAYISEAHVIASTLRAFQGSFNVIGMCLYCHIHVNLPSRQSTLMSQQCRLTVALFSLSCPSSVALASLSNQIAPDCLLSRLVVVAFKLR